MGMQTMERLQLIYSHPLYVKELEGICDDEKDRAFCRHDMEHLLDVARICTILCYQEGLIGNDISMELIYATAMLHDIGRHRQNMDGTPHDLAGARIAEEGLRDCKFGEHEVEVVIDAIMSHRNNRNAPDGAISRFADIFRAADKKSRTCYRCDAREECKWPKEKMNLKVGI